uniref:Uncharacterized protein n=1 Tax=Zygnema circumcarinatum TaxID=35869 RepID=Q32RI9_ZYGCR|nr:hypothetical protein P8547_pgp033 [Zygnema circumcarinatum]AAX45890.1 hypothetical protein [Zygnema circumcarinatum]
MALPQLEESYINEDKYLESLKFGILAAVSKLTFVTGPLRCNYATDFLQQRFFLKNNACFFVYLEIRWRLFNTG